jgi:hypothetical protein
MKTNKIKNTTQYGVFYFVCLHLVYGSVQHILCRVFYFVCLHLGYGGVQHILCGVFYFVCLHLGYGGVQRTPPYTR